VFSDTRAERGEHVGLRWTRAAATCSAPGPGGGPAGLRAPPAGAGGTVSHLGPDHA
jgi:hypothetical protein